MLNKNIFFALFFAGYCTLAAAASSLPEESKITITSNKASCQQHLQNKKQFTFTYSENVKVTFSDGINASADTLVVEIDTEKNTATSVKESKTDQIKTITMSDHVHFAQPGRKARADKAVFYPEKKQCLLIGNVHINQKQTDNKTIPMSVSCSKAALDLVSGNVKLLGTDQAPVSTTLVLNKKSSLLQQPLVQKYANNSTPVAKRSA